jgi:hypothetical protein
LRLPGYDAVSYGEWFPAFRRLIVVSCSYRSTSRRRKSVLLLGMLGPEYEVITILYNSGNNSPDDTASHPRRLKSRVEIPLYVTHGFISSHSPLVHDSHCSMAWCLKLRLHASMAKDTEVHRD